MAKKARAGLTKAEERLLGKIRSHTPQMDKNRAFRRWCKGCNE